MVKVTINAKENGPLIVETDGRNYVYYTTNLRIKWTQTSRIL